jgi:hypothetical protein
MTILEKKKNKKKQKKHMGKAKAISQLNIEKINLIKIIF